MHSLSTIEWSFLMIFTSQIPLSYSSFSQLSVHFNSPLFVWTLWRPKIDYGTCASNNFIHGITCFRFPRCIAWLVLFQHKNIRAYACTVFWSLASSSHPMQCTTSVVLLLNVCLLHAVQGLFCSSEFVFCYCPSNSYP